MADVRVTREGSVLLIRMDNAESRNALTTHTMGALADAFADAARDDDIRAVVTTGTGLAYSVGGDLRRMQGKAPRSGSDSPVQYGRYGLPPTSPQSDYLDRFGPGRWAEMLWSLDKPTIAALNGSAAGGGLGLALVHDYRISVPQARFATGFIKVGISPEMGLSLLLPQLIGWRAATDMLLRGRALTAGEAVDVALVDRVVEPENLLGTALELAAELSSLPPLAVRATKQLLRRAQQAMFVQQLEAEYWTQRRLFATHDHAEGVAAFLARRDPVFRGN